MEIRKLSKRKKMILLGLSILLVLCTTLGLSYAYWKYSAEQQEENLVESACINITLSDGVNGSLSLNKAHPITNEEGEKETPYIFNVTNTCRNSLDYNVTLEVLKTAADQKLDSKNIAIKLDDEVIKVLSEFESVLPTIEEADENYILFSGRIGGEETIQHELRMWLHESAGIETTNKIFSSKVSIDATTPAETLETPDILVYRDNQLIRRIENQEKNQEIDIYSADDITAILSKENNNKPVYYSETLDGEKHDFGSSLVITPTLEGTVRYIYIEGSTNYIKLNVIKAVLEDKKLLVVAGTNKNVGDFTGTSVGNIVYGASSDEEIAVIEDNKVIAKKAGTVTIPVEDTDNGATSTLTVYVISVNLTPNGGNFMLGDDNTATLKVNVDVSDYETISYAWSNSGSLEPESYTNLVSNEISKSDCTEGNYYLWLKIEKDGVEEIYVSKAYIISKNTITIIPKETALTGQEYEVEIVYPENTVEVSRKAGFGETLIDAKNNMELATAPTTIITVDKNGYVFARAQDEMGNVITASLEIGNFEIVTPPEIEGGSDVYASTQTIRIKTPGTAPSGVKNYEYAVSETNQAPGVTGTYTTTDDEAIITKEGTSYVFYRTVANSGVRSAWSASQMVKVYYKARSIDYNNSNDTTIKTVQDVLDRIYEFMR